MVSTISRSDEKCFGCGASAKFHLQNPFGVYYVDDSVQRTFWEWNTRPSVPNVMMCSVYMSGDTYMDHDTLFRYLSS